ncbi:MAG: formate--phosphoribosylaminoimidazolecarboxamide ligase [Candidatus Bathyarchaeota archaeon]|nr:MAG: formate--phosphoribosylaminoimidazolecarboxamide ligase [Candidatus Bathyarchaeota archaeon]
MISKNEIDHYISNYDLKNIQIGTICSHSALQIFLGAKQEGFKTFGICLRKKQFVYEAFPLAKPDNFMLIDDYEEILDSTLLRKMIDNNVIIIPHGSFVEYIGSKSLENTFFIPIFGNRKTLEWEGSRKLQRLWLEKAGLKLPVVYNNPSEIDDKVFVKFSGAKGGKGFFTANSEKEFYEKLNKKIKKGILRKEDSTNPFIQEFVSGVRYYPHYFYSQFKNLGLSVREGFLEFLSMDKRVEPIDESYRGLPDSLEDFYDYTVTGNQSIIVRESLLSDVLEMGVKTVDTSINLFPPGILGPFSLETIYHPNKGFTVFEVSARIVAGTNLYPHGSPYSFYTFKKPISMGRRIAIEIKEAIRKKALERVVS